MLQVRGDLVRRCGLAHPLGDDGKGLRDMNPGVLTRERILDCGGMAGLAFAARSAQKVREAEDELIRLAA